jgi:hypothetical protein
MNHAMSSRANNEPLTANRVVILLVGQLFYLVTHPTATKTDNRFIATVVFGKDDQKHTMRGDLPQSLELPYRSAFPAKITI